jgi:hypothetical protein
VTSTPADDDTEVSAGSRPAWVSDVLTLLGWNLCVGGSFLLSWLTGIGLFLLPLSVGAVGMGVHQLRHPAWSFEEFVGLPSRDSRFSKSYRTLSGVTAVLSGGGGTIALIVDAFH